MKVVKYPNWKKKYTCKCGTTYIITSKDVAKERLSISHWPNHHVYAYCPFCGEQNNISIDEFFNKTNS